MAGTGNGNYVTRAELSAHLDPMRDDIGEISRDVKTLLAAQASQEGARLARRTWLDSRRFVITITVAIVAALATSLAALVAIVVG